MSGTFVTAHGPIFDGRAALAAHQYCDDLERDYAQEGLQMMEAYLPGVLKHPTGHYQSSLHVARSGDGQEITDGGIIYGHWLEGTGSRNRTTRFKGYHHFRMITQRMNAKAGVYANSMIKRYIGRMN